MEELQDSNSSIESDGFKNGFEIAEEKGINIKHETKAIKAFRNIESIFKQPEDDNTIANTRKKNIDTVQAVKVLQANMPEPKKPEIFQGSNSSTTTTPKISQDKPNVRLDRLGRISITILDIIRDNGAVTNRDICNKLNKNNNYVLRYLYRLQDYGFIYRNNENWKWYLHDLDNDFFVDLDNILYYIYNDNTTTTQQRHNNDTIYKVDDVSSLNNNQEIKIKEKKPKQETQKMLKTKQLNLVEFLQKARQDQIKSVVVVLSPIERKILMILASWYDETQAEATARPYKRYESDYAFAEEVGHSLQEVKVALAKLDDRGYVYTLPPKQDKYGMWKIGFTEDFLEKVRNR